MPFLRFPGRLCSMPGTSCHHRALRWVCAAPCGLTPNEVDSVLSGWHTGHHVTHPALGWMCGARGLIPNKVDSVLSRWYAGHHVTHPALGWMCAVPVALSLSGWYAGHHVTHPALGWMCAVPVGLSLLWLSPSLNVHREHHVTRPALGGMCAVPVALSLTHSIQHSKIT